MKTYGTLSYVNGKFRLADVPSYVRVLLKRVFHSVAREDRSDIVMSATEAHARDLEWLFSRYPVEMDGRVALRLSDLATAHRRREAEIHGILSGSVVPKRVPLAIPLRNYQEQAADAAYVSKQLLLGDEVGVGKSASSIGLFIRPEARPALVVCMTHLPKQWESEIKKFAPNLRVFIVPLGEPKDFRTLGVMPDVVICTYSRLAKWETLLAGKFKTIVFDEVQELRRNDSNKYRAATTIAGTVEYRLGLSATPVYNYGGEIYWIMQAIAPGLLGAHDEFSREWCETWSMGSKTLIKDPEALGGFLRDQGVFLRRTAKDVGRELPAVQVIPWTVETEDSIIEAEELALERLATLIMERSGTRLERMQSAGEFDMRMRRATGLAKAPFVAGLVRMLLDSGEKVVLYGWHHAVYERWRELLKDFNPVFFTGRESAVEKERAKAAFLGPNSNLIILSLRSGAGVDGLQHVCRTVVFGELDWSPGIHHQCTGRVWRDGQNLHVNAYYAISESGSDPVVCDVLDIKRIQAKAIIEQGKDEPQREVDPNHVRKLAEAWLARKRRMSK